MVVDGLIHITSAGACTITASQDGSANWLPARLRSLVARPATTSTVLATNRTAPAGSVLHLVATVSSLVGPVSAGSMQFFQAASR